MTTTFDEFGEPPQWAKSSTLPEPPMPKPVEQPLNSFISSSSQGAWPDELHKDALYGLAGDIVRTMEPHTEADPAALLLNLLVAFGNAVGRGPHFAVGGARHYTGLNANLVGETAKARKGTSWNPIAELFKRIDPDWVEEHILSGLSSGEGLIWCVRDAVPQRQPVREDGRVIEYQEVITDQGVSDKRLLVIEEEFGRVLQVMNREGNVLSAVIRQAWDSGNLRVMSKTSPAKATNAHISIIGHITKDELLNRLKSNDTSNGFANRFLWMVVKRSKSLPEGGRLPETDFVRLAQRLADTVSMAKFIQEIRRDEEAKKIWASVYPKLSEGRPGAFGNVTSRAESQVMRLACIYALMDQSELVKADHLLAALAVWNKVDASVRYIFGTMTGDAIADAILDALHTEQKLNLTGISAIFGRNLQAGRITNALSLLERQGLAQAFKTYTNGRPEVVWRLTGGTKETK